MNSARCGALTVPDAARAAKEWSHDNATTAQQGAIDRRACTRRKRSWIPHRLAQATDTELADVFRKVTTLPLETFVNEGGHRVDLAARTIFNDEHWKGWLPKG